MNLSTSQKIWLVALRLAIGWHFLYEGLVKLVNPNWSSVSYLLDSGGFMKNIFYSLAGNPDILTVVDLMTIWGLILIGLALILGMFCRVAVISGMVLLAFFYLSHPPFIGMKYAVPSEGSYLVVNKILIEMLALGVLYVLPASKEFGLDRFIFKSNKRLTYTEQ